MPGLLAPFASSEGASLLVVAGESGGAVAMAAGGLAFACLLGVGAARWLKARRLAVQYKAEADAHAAELARLRRTEARYRAALDAVSCVAWVTDPQGNVLSPESSLCPFTGCDPASARALGWLHAVHDKDRPAVVSEWQVGLASGCSFEMEARIFNARHGGYRAYFVRAAPVRDASGTLLEWMVTLQDVDDRRQSERERREIERRAQESQRMESLGVLAGGIAHDFNNLLVGVMGHADWMSRRIEAYSPLQDNLKRIVGAAERAALLCKQMLAFAGRGRMEIESCDLSMLVRELQGTLLNIVPPGTKFCVRAEAKLAVVEADPAELQQVLISLVTNSAEAFEGRVPGSISVSVGSAHFDAADLTRTKLGARCEVGEYVYIEVCDDGPGIASEVLPRIFDPFFSTKFVGRGLSLAAVLGIARSHRGTIDVVSEPGVQTRVRFLLPAQRTELQSVRAPSAGSAAAATVLVVDDDAEVRELARLTLEDVGAQVWLANGGQQAIEVLRAQRDRIELVLLDLTMPGLDSATTLRELRAIKPEIRVVLSSGYLPGEAMERMGETGFDAFLQKPWRPSSLVQKLTGTARKLKGSQVA